VNRLNGALALVVLAACGVAMAQTPPSQSMSPSQSQYPSEHAPPASTSQSDQSAKEARKQQVKDCMAQQEANNSGMSKKELKKYCKNQVESNAQPHS
jgi:Spy/CpxP family protein refolding chaperone